MVRKIIINFDVIFIAKSVIYTLAAAAILFLVKTTKIEMKKKTRLTNMIRIIFVLSTCVISLVEKNAWSIFVFLIIEIVNALAQSFIDRREAEFMSFMNERTLKNQDKFFDAITKRDAIINQLIEELINEKEGQKEAVDEQVCAEQCVQEEKVQGA